MNRDESTFLKSVDNDRNKVYYARIAILDKLEKPIKSIEGRVQEGSSLSINGSSSMRRTCTLNLIAEEDENDLTNIDNYLSINKKIKLEIGLKYNIDYSKDVKYFMDNSFQNNEGEVGKIYVNKNDLTYWYWNNNYIELNSIFDYPDTIVWFPMGVFVITQPSLTHNPTTVNISLNLQDKMCLLNGSMGGGLPTSVTFHEYDQMIGEVDCETDPRTDSDLELNEYTIYKYDNKYYSWTRQYGFEETDGSEIGTIAHIPQLFYDIIQTVVIRFGNESPSRVIINDVPREIKQIVRWTSNSPLYHNTANGVYLIDETQLTQENTWRVFNFNEDVGYVYTDFTYPGELITNIGDNVCTVLDKIIASLGNYEYFYDIDGNFVFQEKRNYLNTSYLPTEIANDTQRFYLDNNWKKDDDGVITLNNNSLCILGRDNYKADYYGDQKSTYNFDDSDELVSNYNNNPVYTNVKNDYHIWGKNNDGYAIHYHLVIKDTPKPLEYVNGEYVFPERQVVFITNNAGKKTGQIRLIKDDEVGQGYRPNDWRAELYMQGLEIQKAGGRPDIYQQELLDLFDAIYEWGYYDTNEQWIPQGRFKADIVQKPNDLQYFLDYLQPVNNLYGVSVDDIGTKMFSYQQDKIIRLYDNEIPDYIMLDINMDKNYRNMIINRCAQEGQKRSQIDTSIYSHLAIGTRGYSAQEIVRNYLYQYTNYNETISIQAVPIYYLDVNRRITIKDKKIGINGDYIINSISLPLSPNSNMNISAIRALNRLAPDYHKEDRVVWLEEDSIYWDTSDVELNEDAFKDNVGDISIIDTNTQSNKKVVFIKEDD